MSDQPRNPPDPAPEQPPAPHGAQPSPPQAAQPYPPQGTEPYPPQGAQPYAPQGGQVYPPQGAQPYPPQANPYGGYTQAPAYAGSRPTHPGSIGYVEQNFGKVASFGQRALAWLVDMAITLIGLVPMIIGILMVVAAAPSSVSTDQFGNPTTSGDADTGLAVAGGLLIALGVLVSLGITLWNRVFKMGRTGQSVGKKVIGLYLLDDRTGRPVGAGMCFLRELVQGLVNQIFYLGWLWMLWDTDKQTLGDKAVHSNVVVVPKR